MFACLALMLAPLIHMVIYRMNGTECHRIFFFGGLIGAIIIIAILLTKYFDFIFAFEYELGVDVDKQYTEWLQASIWFDRFLMRFYTAVCVILITLPFWLPCIAK